MTYLLAGVRIYVNMTCGPNDPLNTAESCSKVHPGWGVFNGTQRYATNTET